MNKILIGTVFVDLGSVHMTAIGSPLVAPLVLDSLLASQEPVALLVAMQYSSLYPKTFECLFTPATTRWTKRISACMIRVRSSDIPSNPLVSNYTGQFEETIIAAKRRTRLAPPATVFQIFHWFLSTLLRYTTKETLCNIRTRCMLILYLDVIFQIMTNLHSKLRDTHLGKFDIR